MLYAPQACCVDILAPCTADVCMYTIMYIVYKSINYILSFEWPICIPQPYNLHI